MWRKIQWTNVCLGFELQTPKAEHGCRIKADHFFGQQIDTLGAQVVVFLSYFSFREKSMLLDLTFPVTFSKFRC